MNIFRKGQAALEFLMTYGWVILAVLIAISAIAYMGILNADLVLPEKCIMPAGMDCTDKPTIEADTGLVTISIKNGGGNTIELKNATINSATCSKGIIEPHFINLKIKDQQTVLMTFNCTEPIQIGKFKADIVILYTNVETGFSHSAFGSISGRSS